VHCNKCGRAFQQREMNKHMKVFHEPLQCPCGVVLEKEEMVCFAISLHNFSITVLSYFLKHFRY
jgi:hypothetical protein